MDYKKLLIYAPTKAKFEEALANNIADQNSIAFIESPKEIWARGLYYPCPYSKDELDTIFEEIQTNISNTEEVLTEFINAIKGNVSENYNSLEKIETIIKQEISDREQNVSDLETKLNGISIVKVTASNENVASSYELHDSNGNVKGVTIDIPKDQSIKDIRMSTLDATLNEEGMIVDGTSTTALCISYILSDGTYKIAHLDYQKFLEETEFKDGLLIDNHEIKINLSTSDTNNKNFIKFEGDNNDSIAVRSMDTNKTYTTEDITVQGGPLASLLNKVGINTITANTDIQSLLMTLFCKELYPYNSSADSWYMSDEAVLGNQPKINYLQPSLTNSIAVPSVTSFSTGTVEAGTKFTYSVSCPSTTVSKTNAKVSNLRWGYSVDKVDKIMTDSIYKNWVTSIADDVYSLNTVVSSGFQGITVTDKTGTDASKPSYTQEVQVADGNNSIKITVTGCAYEGSCEEIPSVYMLSNLGKTNDNIKTNVIQSKSITLSRPTNTITKTVTGARFIFAGTKQGTPGVNNMMELTSNNIRLLTSKGTNSTFSITIPDNTSHVYIAVPQGRTLKSVKDKGAFGTDIVASFILNTASVEGANNYTAKTYSVYVYSPDALLGSNTYDVTIN